MFLPSAPSFDFSAPDLERRVQGYKTELKGYCQKTLGFVSALIYIIAADTASPENSPGDRSLVHLHAEEGNCVYKRLETRVPPIVAFLLVHFKKKGRPHCKL